MPVLDAVDLSLARDFARAPGELDHLALGAVATMQAAAILRRHEEGQRLLLHAGLVADALLAYGGMRGEGFKAPAFGTHFQTWTGGKAPGQRDDADALRLRRKTMEHAAARLRAVSDEEGRPMTPEEEGRLAALVRRLDQMARAEARQEPPGAILAADTATGRATLTNPTNA